MWDKTGQSLVALMSISSTRRYSHHSKQGHCHRPVYKYNMTASEKNKPSKEKGMKLKQYEMSEKLFLDTMKNMVVKQLQQMTDIASIQDQVVMMIRAHEERKAWLNSSGLQRYTSRHFFTMHKETRTFLCLAAFLLLQLLIQLAFSGYFRHLVPHLPDFVQNLLLK